MFKYFSWIIRFFYAVSRFHFSFCLQKMSQFSFARMWSVCTFFASVKHPAHLLLHYYQNIFFFSSVYSRLLSFIQIMKTTTEECNYSAACHLYIKTYFPHKYGTIHFPSLEYNGVMIDNALIGFFMILNGKFMRCTEVICPAEEALLICVQSFVLKRFHGRNKNRTSSRYS